MEKRLLPGHFCEGAQHQWQQSWHPTGIGLAFLSVGHQNLNTVWGGLGVPCGSANRSHALKCLQRKLLWDVCRQKVIAQIRLWLRHRTWHLVRERAAGSSITARGCCSTPPSRAHTWEGWWPLGSLHRQQLWTKLHRSCAHHPLLLQKGNYNSSCQPEKQILPSSFLLGFFFFHIFLFSHLPLFSIHFLLYHLLFLFNFSPLIRFPHFSL